MKLVACISIENYYLNLHLPTVLQSFGESVTVRTITLADSHCFQTHLRYNTVTIKPLKTLLNHPISVKVPA